jgi:glycosyltransferase involved in cell wall biosynthesis
VLKQKGDLVLLTNHYPFGSGEAFLETEVPYLVRHFNRVIIITKNITDELRANQPELRCYRVSAVGNVTKFVLALPTLISNLPLAFSFTKTEVSSLRRRKKKVTISIFRKMMHDLLKAIERARHINAIIRKETKEKDIFLYSYWLDSTALATIFSRDRSRRVIRISRAHGGDLYEYRHPDHYLSFRPVLINNLDAIFTISDNGNQYLRERADGNIGEKIKTSRLGVKSQTKTPAKLAPPYTIVSCSFLLPVKRIDLLIRSLALSNLQIRWIHIGDGPLINELKALAEQLLGNTTNIRWAIKGRMSNQELLNFYRTEVVHLFINCSESEGIPVTIMEAQSYGIPVIAPAVGGVPEIVSSENGRLIEKDSPAPLIERVIKDVLTLPEEEYQALRDQSYQTWATHYNADRNFSNFISEIRSLANEA